MQENDYWNVFFASGSVEDYLNYCKCAKDTVKKEKDDAAQHKGTYTQGTEYR